MINMLLVCTSFCILLQDWKHDTCWQEATLRILYMDSQGTNFLSIWNWLLVLAGVIMILTSRPLRLRIMVKVGTSLKIGFGFGVSLSTRYHNIIFYVNLSNLSVFNMFSYTTYISKILFIPKRCLTVAFHEYLKCTLIREIIVVHV